MATTAKTRQDVENMSARERLWDSLSNAYGTKTKKSNESFEKAYSQADRQALSRGMQRSSYNLQTLANIDKQKIDAANEINSELIADYENRLGQLEQQELENEWREKEFAENQRQFNENQALTRSENALNRAFQTSEREAQQAYQSNENALNRSFTTSEREAQQAYQSGENALARAFQTSEREAQQAYQSEESALARAFQTAEREAQQQYQSGENALNREFQSNESALARAFEEAQNALSREQNQSQFEANLALSREQAAQQQANADRAYDYQVARDIVTDEQWQKAFNQQVSDTDRQIALEYAQALLDAEQPVPQSLLKQAGLSIIGNRVVMDTNYTGNSGSSGGYSGGSSGSSGGSNKASNSGNTSTTGSTMTEDEFKKILYGNSETTSGWGMVGLAANVMSAAADLGKDALTKGMSGR